MNGINLHNVVRSAITSIHPDEECTLYQSLGQKNVKGKVTPVYLAPKTIRANFQPLDANTLKHLEAMNDTAATEQVFLYSNDPYPIAGESRIATRSGDILKRDDGTYWLITSVIEDWSWDGWCNVGVHRQVVTPNFSASEWSEDYAGT